ncbi:hypothetical protein G7Y89_g508 [Cudoniella acicularis]|uniref:Nuclear pore complex protein Nup85 n=1 Tax=Cudoniella acicularis TaxID=354080 RepID=A0A8H4WAD4_9HELO|nr:hypothetical protein G7Y89_g508 [Cudoniella acicularis]
MSYQVPYSSSPPSTPPRPNNNGGRNPFGASNNPSTTPAGPPPSSAGSFTPAGPPPTSIFGSSMLGATSSVKPLSFSKQPAFDASQHGYEDSTLNTEYQRDEEEEEDAEYMEEEQDQYDQSEQSYDDNEEAQEEEDDEDMDDYRSELPRRDSLLSTPGLRRSRNGTILSSRDSQKASVYGKIAKDLYSQMDFPTMDESDDLILNTEAMVTRLYDEGVEGDDEYFRQAVTDIAGELTLLWAEYHRRTEIPSSEEYTTSIGPGPRSSNFAKANFLASLALPVYHPQPDLDSFDHKPKLLPQTMLEWMFLYHDPYPQQFEEIQAHRPSPANHRLFWDVLFNSLLRGKVVAVAHVLKNAGWRYAKTGLDDIRDPSGQTGYTGRALANVERVVNAASQVVAQCPAVNGDWNTRGSDWTLFRLRVSQALEDLKSFAEGRNKDRDDPADFGSSAFKRSSMASRPDSYTTIAKKAESQVPWHIYQNILTLYGLLIGDSDAIIENSQDWCEATIGLLVWWDEGRDERRVALGRGSYRASARESDADAYLRKLRKSFETATADKTDFQVNTLNPVEVAIASLLENDIEAVVGFLRGWSGPVSSAVAEIATIGGWLPEAEPQNLINMGSLDQDDMDVLGISASPSKTDGVKDQTLIVYATSLSHRGHLQSSGSFGPPLASREGWEIAIAVLGRLDSAARSEEMVGNFLKEFHLDSSGTVDKLWILLNDIGMSRHAQSTAESYADLLAEDSHNYELSQMDMDAAELLHKMLSGYATLRKFYDLRDEEVLLSKGKKAQASALRNSEAATALLAVIASSDDNIRGGLYDEERGAVVSVDFLLALLGEAMVFVDQPKSAISVAQIDILLKAIEDLQAVGPRVYLACTEFLQTVIASAQGLKGSSPNDMLRKSTSNISGTSSFSMVGSSMLASQLKQSMGSSGVLVKGNVKRGWDWRHGISAGTSGDDVLKILRLGLAKDLAKAWLKEADSSL